MWLLWRVMGKLSFFKIVIRIDKKSLTEISAFSRLFENGNVKNRNKDPGYEY